MGFLSDLFTRTGRVARGHASDAVSALEDANFESTVRQTVADMKTELNNVVRASAMAELSFTFSLLLCYCFANPECEFGKC